MSVDPLGVFCMDSACVYRARMAAAAVNTIGSAAIIANSPGIPTIDSAKDDVDGFCGGDDNCMRYILDLNYIVEELNGRYNDMLIDQHSLYSRHKKIKNRHPKYGSYQGHQKRYLEEQKELNARVGQLPPGCRQYAPHYIEKWMVMPPPPHPM